MLELGSAQPGIVVNRAELDADPWLLNLPNGTLELQTGILQPHDRAHLCTKVARVPYLPDAKAPRFEAFLREALEHPAVIAFVLRCLAYSLSGSVDTHGFLALTGIGRNGKGVLLRIFAALLGDCADQVPGSVVV